MKSIIIYISYHHNNTEKIAKVLANTLSAETKKVDQTDQNCLSEYDLIGFGSGIYFGKHHKNLLKFVEKLPQTSKKAFIFSTAGTLKGRGAQKYHDPLKTALQQKGFEVIGEFGCLGFGTFALTKLVGGISKGRPNSDDFKKAEDFAKDLMNKINA